MNAGSQQTTRAAKIGATTLLLIGSIIAYAFVIKIICRIWDPQAYLQSPLVGVFAGVFLYGGIRLWPRWRFPLGIICLLLGALAFFNSTQYESLHNLPEIPGFRTGPEVLRAMSHASIVMACIAVLLGPAFLYWQRMIERHESVEKDA